MLLSPRSRHVESRQLQKMALGNIQKLGQEVFHAQRYQPNLTAEVVIGHDRRNRCGQADGGGNQSLGDAWRDRLNR